MSNTQTLIATLEGAPEIIISLVREVPPQNLKRRPSPNQWPAHEHACHISTADAAYLSRLELMLSDPAGACFNVNGAAEVALIRAARSTLTLGGRTRWASELTAFLSS